MAGTDGRLKYPLRHAKIAERAGYGIDAVRKSLRRLSGRDQAYPCHLVAVESGKGHTLSRFTVALSWAGRPPAFLDVDEPVSAVPEESTPTRAPRPRPSLAEIAPHGAAWFPPEPPEEEPPPVDERQGDVLELHSPPDVDDRDTWCADAQRAGEPHTGRRCCGMTPRQLKAKEARDQREEKRRRELEQFSVEFGPQAKAKAVPTEEAIERNAAYAAMRATIGKRTAS